MIAASRGAGPCCKSPATTRPTDGATASRCRRRPCGIARWCDDPSVAVAVAATYVVGFRAGARAQPARAGVDAISSGHRSRHARWNTSLNCRSGRSGTRPRTRSATMTTLLATRASVHHDAHLVKYTLACLDAADWDREHARLYLSAAAAAAQLVDAGGRGYAGGCFRICVTDDLTSWPSTFTSTSSSRRMCRHDLPFVCLPKRSTSARCGSRSRP